MNMEDKSGPDRCGRLKPKSNLMVANGHVSAFNNVFRKRPTGTAVFWARMVVEFSEDLRTWAPLTTNTVPGSLEIFIGGGSGFYRAVVLP